jgi:mycothiol synthase
MKLRPPREDDFEAMLEVINASARAADGEDEYGADDFRNWLASPKLIPERDVRVAEENGRLIGYADVDPQGTDPVRWWCELRVHPESDAGEVLPSLVSWAEERAQKGILRCWASSRATDLPAAYERLGFRTVRHSFRMALELDPKPGPPAWPDGVEVRPFERGEEREVYEAVRETWLDTWEPWEESFEDWSHWTIGRAGFDPSFWFLARAGDEIAGFSLCLPNETRADTCIVSLLGVRRPWRRRGLGEALLRHSFAEFRRRGFRRAQLGVDADSPTGATRLYERVGMHVVRRIDFYEKQLDGR